MKIAVASEEKYISEHFGHCEGFTIYHLEGGKVTNKDLKQNPGHRPGFLPEFLKDLGVNVIIAGGMGETAQELFNEKEIDVIVGSQGVCDDVMERYIRGELKSTGSVCREHEHEGHCND